MKKILLLLAVLVVSSSGQLVSQIVYSNNFNSSVGPILGFYDNDGLLNSSSATETWMWAWNSRSFANAAMYGGGALRSITETWPPTTTPNSDWVFLPLLTMPTDARLVFEFQAEVSYDAWHGYPGLDVKVSTTDTLFPSYTTVKTITYSGSRVTLEYVDLSAYAGQDIYIAFVNTAPSSPYYGWRRISIDDVNIGAFPDYDLRCFNFLPTHYSKTGDANTIKGSFVNTGNEILTSIDLNYRVNGGSVVTEALTGLSVDPFDTIKIDHGTDWTPSAAGVYDIEIWADNLNGNSDGDNTNDTIYRAITVYDKVTKKRPLFEVFSGADCSACAPLAADIEPFIDAWKWNEYNGDFSNIEYQTFTLDPSNNADGVIRDSYYSVSGYPDEQITETTDYKTLLFESTTNSWYPFFDFSESKASSFPAFIEMDMDVTLSGNNVSVTVNATPLKNFSGDYRMHIAVCEHEYTYTGGSTGQTEFKHVMRKMLPDGNGTTLGSLTDGVPVSVTEDYTFTIGGVVDGSFNLWVGMDNVEVVAFIQNNSTEEVIQSVVMGPADIAGISEHEQVTHLFVYPVPADDILFLKSTNNSNIQSVEVTSVSGVSVLSEINPDSGAQMVLNTSELSAGIYFVNAFGLSGELVGFQKFVIR